MDGLPHTVCSGTTRTCENGGPPPLPFSGGEEGLHGEEMGRGGETAPPGRGGETPPLLFSAVAVGTPTATFLLEVTQDFICCASNGFMQDISYVTQEYKG